MIPAGLAPGSVVEVIGGTRKAQRGVVVGEARSTYRGVPDWDVRMKDGTVRPFGPAMLRVLAPAPTETDDDICGSAWRKVTCP